MEACPSAIVNGDTPNAWLSNSAAYAPEFVMALSPDSDILGMTGGPMTGVHVVTFSATSAPLPSRYVDRDC